MVIFISKLLNYQRVPLTSDLDHVSVRGLPGLDHACFTIAISACASCWANGLQPNIP